MSGGAVKVEWVKYKHVGDGSERGQSLHATCRNRICSESIVSSGYLYKVAETAKVINGSVGGDVMLIHDNYYTKKLKFLCLAEDNNGSRNIMRWNYKNLNIAEGKSEYHEAIGNVHAVQCAGRSVSSDVLATISFKNAKYKSLQHTWRCSTGEDLKISISIAEGIAEKT
ncbi:uncharacterized protein [Macrobrachium rosenbergii]|uniref:uncharacterized protein n=1 Tax=Macrobrachium rosenbergii TaxID=79674 RepID=UPI0034D5A15C